jgi:hypothetical protein
MKRVVHLLGRLMPTLLCVAGVPVTLILLVHRLFGVSISAFRPLLNDEVTYWHQALTFSRVGFHGGYYTLGEMTNASGLTPFGPHGPGFAVLYGSVGALFGWHRHSVVVLNLIAISAGAALWVLLSKLNSGRLWLSGAALVTFWPMMFWAPSGMQEGLHYAGAIAMAAMFAHALRSDRQRVVMAAGWVLLAVLSFVRPSWLVLIPIWALVTIRPRTMAITLATLAAAALLGIAILIAYNRSVAPFPTGFFFLKLFDLTVGVRAVWDNVRFNITKTLAFREYQPLEVLHRVQYWGWLIMATATVAIGAWRAGAPGGRAALSSHLLVAIAAMWGALSLMFLLYTLTNLAEHRVLSAFLLFGVLVCVAAPGRAAPLIAAALVVSNAAAAPLFLTAFAEDRRDNFVWDRRGVYELADAIESKLVYQAGSSRWCNTLLASQFPPYLIAIPAGIGLSVVREADQLPLPPKSQYLLLDQPSLSELRRPLQLERLATLPYGTLYRNLEARCP